MDKIICIIESHRAVVYDVCLGKALFQGEHSLEELPLFLRTLRAWNRTLHLLDLSSTTHFRWERAPDGLTRWERMQWFREKTKQFSKDGYYNLWSVNRKEQCIGALKITHAILPQWIEQKLKTQCVALFYHSYPFELVRNIKTYFDTSYEKFQCFILQRLNSSSIFAVYYKNFLVFLRILFPMSQNSLTQWIQETVHHVEETFHTHSLEFVCLGDQEIPFAEINRNVSKEQSYYGINLEKWMEQHSIFPVSRCESVLDRFVLAQAHTYQALKSPGKPFFFNILEPALRRFSWIQILPLIVSGSVVIWNWKYKIELKNEYAKVLQQWKALPWTMEQFLNAEPKLHACHKQCASTMAYVQRLESMIPDKTFLEKIEWTQTKSSYGFNFLNSDKILQKNLLMTAWRQHQPSQSAFQWKEHVSSSLNEMEELDYYEGESPFFMDL
ncbi:hypothetical protein P618_200937 [Holospora obtusa F1]|uniref:Uncharacterized protein n=1 Tax=Holospora obtusa F1 TaxID=1399147 RepID=W6TDQ7_HOLOB|nr:hypothetical protein [Holospora obtusa]ETZ06901.1 hypothetical protein P618_200937 [Holospora obtusa F1]